MNTAPQATIVSLSTKQKIANTFALIIVCIVVLPFVAILISDFIYALSDAESIILMFKQIYWYLHNSITSTPIFLLSLPLIFVLQRYFPAIKSQPNFNRAVMVDATYSVIMLLFYVAVAPKFFIYIKTSFLFPEMTLWSTNANNLHYFWQLLIGYLAVDFLGWLHHLIRHKVPFFWTMHAVHHSQQELNPFSNERVHVFDWFVANIIKFLPALFFTESLGIILNYIVIHKFLDHLNHANIKTNLGPLKYILVTPQSHRVHHSCEKEFFDKNFGVSLSVWDHLFGTQCKNYDVYPATGVPDSTFPNEQDADKNSVLSAFIKQQIYPFKKIVHYLKN